MRTVVQRVSSASVKVDDDVIGCIDIGFLVLVGFTHSDTEEKLCWTTRKLVGLRVFEDNAGRMNLSLPDVGGSVLVVSQFTLYADIRKGRRPAFSGAAEPEMAERLYNRFCELLRTKGVHVEMGVFGAKMEVELVNDGPVTIIIDSCFAVGS